MHHRTPSLASTSESNVSDSISFLQRYLNTTATNKPPSQAETTGFKLDGRGSGPGQRSFSSPSPRTFADNSDVLFPSQRRPGSRDRARPFRFASATSSPSPSAQRASVLPTAPAAAAAMDWRPRRAHSFSEGSGTDGWQRVGVGDGDGGSAAGRSPRLFGSRGGKNVYGNPLYPSAASSVSGGSGGYREGSAIPRIQPLPYSSRFRNGSFHDDQYDGRPSLFAHGRQQQQQQQQQPLYPVHRPTGGDLSSPHRGMSLSSSQPRGGGRGDPSAYQVVPSDPSRVRGSGLTAARLQPPSASTTTVAESGGPPSSREESVGGAAVLSPPRRSAPPPPSPPQVPLQEPRSAAPLPTAAALPGQSSQNPYANISFPLADTHQENLRTITQYLKHYYAREVEEDHRGLETLLPEDILGLSQCFYVDLYRLVREQRRQLGLAVNMFTTSDPDVGAVAPTTPPARAEPGPEPRQRSASHRTPPSGGSRVAPSPRSSDKRRAPSAAATATYTGNNDDVSDSEKEEEEGEVHEGERRVLQAVAHEIIKSLASTPRRNDRGGASSSSISRRRRESTTSPSRQAGPGEERGRSGTPTIPQGQGRATPHILLSPKRDHSGSSETPSSHTNDGGGGGGGGGAGEARVAHPHKTGEPHESMSTPPRAMDRRGSSVKGAARGQQAQWIEAKVPTFVQPFGAPYGGHSRNGEERYNDVGNDGGDGDRYHRNSDGASAQRRQSSMSWATGQMETKVYQDSDDNGSVDRGSRERAGMSRQAQQRILASLPNSPYGTRKILPQSDLLDRGGRSNAGGGHMDDENTMAFLRGTPSRNNNNSSNNPSPSSRPRPARSGRRQVGGFVDANSMNAGGMQGSAGRPPAVAASRSPFRNGSANASSLAGGKREQHSGVLKRPLGKLMPLLRRGAGLVKFISETRRPHLRFFMVQDCLDTFRGHEVLMPHLTWRPIPSDSSAAEMQARVVAQESSGGRSHSNGGSHQPAFLSEFDTALNLVGLLGVHVGTAAAPHLFKRGKARQKRRSSGEDALSPVVDHEGNPLPEERCAVLVFQTRTLGLGFLTEGERQVWVGAMMGVVERNKTLGT